MSENRTLLRRIVEEVADRSKWPPILCRDRPRAMALWRRLQQGKGGAEVGASLRALLEASHTAWKARAAARPVVSFPPELPVSERATEIIGLIANYRVVVVCGETGSGKSTQLPKMALAAGRGIAGQIAHTQPRRVAARTIAARLAEELGEPLGKSVGYRVRFEERAAAEGYVTLMTDGLLLAESQSDPWLNQYDTVIVDEAHERSLNVDFLLGYLHRLLTRRDDLRVVITSATIEAERFAAHFQKVVGKVPVVEVSGRLYPVEVRYRPVTTVAGEEIGAWLRGEEGERARRLGEMKEERGREGRDLYEAIVACVAEAWQDAPGDVLVFLPGEREIREAREVLEQSAPSLPFPFEVLPLFARQSATEQQRVFRPSGNGLRVVLATNVAETSLTVPNVRYVIDTGLARLNRYNPRSRVEQLKVEPISQAAAQQRAGRCGRVMAGVCFRLYDEDDFSARPRQTDPEIVRTSLAGVALRMLALRLGEVTEFPFLDPPPRRAVEGAYQELIELGAVDGSRRSLTPVGEAMAKLPVDPHLARLLVAGEALGCLREARVIAAALSIPDPRERPLGEEQAADQQHALFRGSEREARSEFFWFLNLWTAWREVARHHSSAKQRAWARAHFLSWLRLREWREVEGELHALTGALGWRDNETPASYEVLHTALLMALPHGVGVRSREEKPELRGSYLGARGVRFWLHPQSSTVRRSGAQWVLAAERVETTRLYARIAAAIDPQWIERAVPHLIVREVSEPRWDPRAGEVRGSERGTLFGLTVYSGRAVSYRSVDPALCRTLFIQEGLVNGNLPPQRVARMAFLQHNLALVSELRALEERLRRSDLVDERLIEAFYERQIPPEVVDLESFEAWRRQAEKDSPRCLFLEREMLLNHAAAGAVSERYPTTFDLYGEPLPLQYVHDPSAPDDGVTLVVPVALLNQVPAARCEWLVPGLLPEKVERLLKSLPPKQRHRLQPLAETVAAFLAEAESHPEWQRASLLSVLARWVEERCRVATSSASFRVELLPPYCLMNFRVVASDGQVLGEGRSLEELRHSLGPRAQSAFAELASVWRERQKEPLVVSKEEVEEAGIERDGEQEEEGKGKEAKEKGRENEGEILGRRATRWVWGKLPELVEAKVAGVTTIGFPGLVDCGEEGAEVRLFDTEEAAAAAHRRGVLRLLQVGMGKTIHRWLKGSEVQEAEIQWAATGRRERLLPQLLEASLTRAALNDGLPRDEEAFAATLSAARERFPLVAGELLRALCGWLTAQTSIERALTRLEESCPTTVADIRTQLAALFATDFLVTTPWERLQHYDRYLRAISVRLEKVAKDPARDLRWLAEWRRAAQPWTRAVAAARGPWQPFWEEYRWLLEELRVGLFASELKTPFPVSVKRLERLWTQQGAV
ncbi:MAG: ATP-dependent RNA helicase HrpA [Hydrogenophilus sp.]|nr:ATP-dependent RNA helicase HrpA [Hydrogenophilus sp.]